MLTVKELAEKMGIHKNTVYRWIKEGMPHYKKSKTIRFDLEKVEEWLQQKK